MTASYGGAASSEARNAGIALIATTLLAIVMMAHHPTAGSHDSAALAQQIRDTATLSRVVHGVLIAVIVAQLYVFLIFSERIGGLRGLPRAGLFAYAVGAMAMTGAALISGFLVSDLAAHYADMPADHAATFADLALFAMTGNQVLAKLGVLAMSAGILAWSIALLRTRENRWLAFVGLLASLVPAVALLAGAIRLNVGGMMIVVLCQAAWNVAAGVFLIRAKS
ncbi:MAG TPA: hypothetical protein VH375_10810 [Rhodanobacteraceae bacterium]